MEKQTTSTLTMKVAAIVIAACITGLGATAINSHLNKVDRSEFVEFCKQNKLEHERLQNQIDQNVEINSELLKALNRMEVKIERVETNTEWLIKETKK